MRSNFFSIRDVEAWNSLIYKVKSAKSVNEFKNGADLDCILMLTKLSGLQFFSGHTYDL